MTTCDIKVPLTVANPQRILQFPSDLHSILCFGPQLGKAKRLVPEQ